MDAGRLRRDPVVRAFFQSIAPLRPRINRIILFGSRARGDEKPYSDYDFLLVVPKRDRDLIDRLYDAVMEVLFATGRDVSLKIFDRRKFDRLSGLSTPFMKNVMREGIILG